MKLTSTQIEQTLDQFEAEPIPENHPMVPQLNEVFGEHTYFVNSDGLIILEPTGSGLIAIRNASRHCRTAVDSTSSQRIVTKGLANKQTSSQRWHIPRSHIWMG